MPIPEDQASPYEDERAAIDKEQELQRKILDLAASDPEFKELLLTDPRAAMERAGLTEEAKAVAAAAKEAEVAGHYSYYCCKASY